MNKDMLLWDNENVLSNIKDKTVVCFGAGTAAEMFLDELNIDISIKFITDNNESLWGSCIRDIEVIDPSRIKDIENIFVLIVSRHIVSIKEQLKEYGLGESIDFYDLYTPNKEYFKLGKFYDSYKKLEKFIDTVPNDLVVNAEKEKIGVALISDPSDIHMFFPIAFWLVLIDAGYNAELIVDFVGEDMSNIRTIKSKEMICQLAENLSNKIQGLSYKVLSPIDKYEFSREELKQIERHTRYGVICHTAYLGYEATSEDLAKTNLKNRIKEETTEHYKMLKSYLTREKYSAICVFKGIISRSANYTYLGHKYGIRVPVYDVFDWSTDYPCCWNYDIPEVAKSFDDIQREKIYQLVDERLNDRITNNKMLHNRCQVVAYQKDFNQNIDVLIPLNVMFDSAVLGLDDIFETPEEWIEETVKYLKNETLYNVVIKESPFFISELNNSSYKELLKPYLDNERIIYYDKDASVNIYNLINNSKVVMPYSSTVGIEAAILGKPVIIHTKCFYRNEGFVKKATTKQEYFDMITKMVSEKNHIVEDLENAKIFYYLANTKKRKNTSIFNELNYDWLEKTFEEIKQETCLKHMIDTVANNMPFYNDSANDWF